MKFNLTLGILAVAILSVGTVAFAQETISSHSASVYQSNLQLREQRRLGVGTHAGGTAGLMGVHVEMNVEDQDGVLTGFGFGDGFSTYSIAWKRNYEGAFLTPYTTLGWSRWFNAGGSRNPDSYMLESTLSKKELEDGRFGVDYIVGSLGAQYNQLDGEYAGASFFAGLDLFAAPVQGRLMPSASVGGTYFF